MRTVCITVNTLLLLFCFRFSIAQNVGIDEPNPSAKLEVRGSANTLLNSLLVKDGNNIPLLSVSNQGRLGINLANPAVPLHVFSNSGSELLRLKGTTPYLSFYDENDFYRGYLWSRPGAIELGSASGSGLPVTIAADATTVATFSPNGNAGFGVNNPLFRVDINGRMRIRNNGQTSGVWFNNASNTLLTGFVGLMSDYQVGFYGDNGGGWGLLMNTINGNVGINTVSSSARLDVQGSGSDDAVLRLGNGKIVYAGAGVNTTTPVFVHKAHSGNTPELRAYTVIDNPYCNSNPEAILIVTMNGTYGGGFGLGYDILPEIPDPTLRSEVISPVSFMVFFNGPNSGFHDTAPDYAKDKWCIRTYNGPNSVSPLNFNFNVMIIHPN